MEASLPMTKTKPVRRTIQLCRNSAVAERRAPQHEGGLGSPQQSGSWERCALAQRQMKKKQLVIPTKSLAQVQQIAV